MSDTSEPVATGVPTRDAEVANLGALRDGQVPQREETSASIPTLSQLGGILGIVGLAVYGSVRFADTMFYARLGTTPDNVRTSYSETLSRVGGPVALVTASVVTTVLCVRLANKKQAPGLLSWVSAVITGIALGLVLPLTLFRWSLALPLTGLIVLVTVTWNNRRGRCAQTAPA